MSENYRTEPRDRCFTCWSFLWVLCIQIHIETATDYIQEEIRRIVVFLDSVTWQRKSIAVKVAINLPSAPCLTLLIQHWFYFFFIGYK